MEVNRSTLMQRIIIGVLFLAIAILVFLLVRVAIEKRDPTPRTALERQLYDALAVIEKNPKNAKARMKLGMVYLKAGRYNDALSELNLAVKLDPKDPEIYYGLGVAARKTGDIPKAIEAQKRATKLEGTVSDIYREAYYELGQIYYDKKDYKKAVDNFLMAVRNGPEAIYVISALARSYDKAGNINKAIQEYNTYLEYDPGNKKIIKELNRLNNLKYKKKNDTKNNKSGGK